MNAAVNAAVWVLGKALAPLGDTVLEAWAGSVKLGPNVEALKIELLCVKAVLEHVQGKEIQSSALDELMQRLRDLAYDAEDVLDELDYFRIQDELDGTSQAADKHAKGCAHGLVLNAGSTARAVAGKLLCASPCSSAANNPGSRPRARSSSTTISSAGPEAGVGGEDSGSCMPRIVSGASNTFRAVVGKRFPCSSLPHVSGDADNHPAMSPKLRFNRVEVSNRMKHIVEQLRPMRHEVSEIIRTLVAIEPSWRIGPSIAPSRPITISESVEPKLYGRDIIMNSIIHDITQGKYCSEDLSVLPIVGPGGIGKTTLAQHIYHNLEVQKYFHAMVWICVPLDFNVDKLAKEIENHIRKDEDKKQGVGGDSIGQILKSKRVLLVLDDMWTCPNEDKWERLLLPFKQSQVKGNVIIVTTRLPTIAKAVKKTGYPIELEGLEHEKFKELFLQFVFGDEQSRNDHIVEILLETGEKIMDKLKGSPLAAKTVGRLLRNHLHLDHWTRVLESKVWELQNGENDIMPALKLSYDYLPLHLQQCFSYCALFPPDYKFDGKQLVEFWIGLDILHSSGQNRNIADIGQSYLDELCDHGFFKKDEIYEPPHYVLHDLLHDLGVKVSSRDCLSVNCSNVESVEILPSLRHLSITIHGMDDNDDIIHETFRSWLRKLKTYLRLGKLQTLMLLGGSNGSFDETFHDLFKEANALRVLCCLSRSVGSSVLLNFPLLVHLRYLRLKVTYQNEMQIPNTLSRLYHLRILDLEEQKLDPFTRFGVRYSYDELIKSHHFITKRDEDKVYSHISNVGQMQSLHHLKRFQVNKENNGFELKQLGNLNELRDLGIYNLEKIQKKKEADDAKIIDKKYLHKLTLNWHNGRPNIDPVMEALVLEGLQPHRNIRELCIGGHGGPYYPTWFGDKLYAKSLHSLHLDSISWEVLPCLGLMPMLQELILEDMDRLYDFVLDFGCVTKQSFSNLKRLILNRLKRLKTWVLGDTFHLFSQLQVLKIINCPELLELPFASNFRHPIIQNQGEKIIWFPNLQVLQIKYCPKIRVLPPIPWTQTLCDIDARSSQLQLKYSKSSSEVNLGITGEYGLSSLDEKVLVLDNLTNVHKLRVQWCPYLESKNIVYSSHELVPLESENDVLWQLSVKSLEIYSCFDGKGLVQFLSHLPILSELKIGSCGRRIRRMGVMLEHEQAEKEENAEGRILLFPAHLSYSLLRLEIHLSEMIALPILPDNCKAGRGWGEGLQALRSLKELRISYCPNLFSAYKTIFYSSYFPFPSSLEYLALS